MYLSRDELLYTSQYCEENVYKLIETLLRKDGSSSTFAVFISNSEMKVPLYYQMKGASFDNPVVWDYHVIAIARSKESDSEYQVFDLDTTLGFPCDVSEYWSKAIRPNSLFPSGFERCFRVVDGSAYLRHFASDRRHMRRGSVWLATPPAFPAISTPEATHNLSKYVEFPPLPQCCDEPCDAEELKSLPFGVVLSQRGFCNFFNVRTR